MHLVAFERLARADRRGAGRGEMGTMGAAALGFEMLEAVRHGTRRMGALVSSGPHAGCVVDLNRALAVKLAAEDAGAPECEADSQLPADPFAFMRRLPLSLDVARATIAFACQALERYDGPDLEGAEIALPRRHVRITAPVQRPGKLVGVATATGSEPQPALFLKAPSALTGPEDEIRLPAHAGPLVFHGELAAIVGRRARAVAPEDALGVVAGYCVAVAVHPAGAAAAALLEWSGDGFAPIGPALVTADEIPDPHDLHLRAQLSGATLQTAHTKELPIPLPELIARISNAMTLEPGDVILSGAPRGGRGRSGRPIRDGDVIEVEIERIGRLAIYVRAGA